MSRKVPWVVAEANGARFRCRRCGDIAEISLPKPISVWCNLADAFSEAHSGCQEPQEAENGPSGPREDP